MGAEGEKCFQDSPVRFQCFLSFFEISYDFIYISSLQKSLEDSLH